MDEAMNGLRLHMRCLIAVNTSGQRVAAKLTLAEPAVSAEVVWEGRTMALSGGTLTDESAPYGALVYKVAGPAR
jgi:hypothetical protein